MAVNLVRLGALKLRGGDGAGALAAYQESLDIRRRFAALHPGDAQAQADLVNSLGGAAFVAVLVKRYQEALSLADEAIAIAPDKFWLYSVRADVLMLLGEPTRRGRSILCIEDKRSRTVGPGTKPSRATSTRFASAESSTR